jgi:predicted DCC family thiol-disulfide oxidoreductase YuxK
MDRNMRNLTIHPVVKDSGQYLGIPSESRRVAVQLPLFSKHISVNSDIPDSTNGSDWILFDGQCRLCTASARRFEPVLARYEFKFAALQTPWVRAQLGMSDEELLSEMRLLTSMGALYGGADALIEIARRIWWAKPLYWFAHLPLAKPVLRKAYRWIAQHRNCTAGACNVRLGGPSYSAAKRKRTKRVFFEMP